MKNNDAVQESVVCRGGVVENFSLFTADMLFYEPYVGLSRMQMDSASLKMGMQNLNAPLQSVVALVEFVPGK